MDMAHDSVVWFAKTAGLFYLLAFAGAVIVYTYWPANRQRFDQAAQSILHDEDEPCR